MILANYGKSNIVRGRRGETAKRRFNRCGPRRNRKRYAVSPRPVENIVIRLLDKFIPVSFHDQILPGSFEYALNEIVDQHIDLSPFAARYANDDTGRLAYDPSVLHKIVLYGYYKGIVSSRKLAESCERHVVFMALTADTRPHFTTIADFVAQMHQEITSVFTDVLLCASELNLIGRDTFAIDGCKLPSNASKQWSGTLKELRHKQKKLDAAACKIVARHQAQDAQEKLSPVVAQEEKKRATYVRKMERIRDFLKPPNRTSARVARTASATSPIPTVPKCRPITA